MAGPYQITIYTALPGTPLVDEQGRPDGTSAAGHMWYQVSDGDARKQLRLCAKRAWRFKWSGTGVPQ